MLGVLSGSRRPQLSSRRVERSRPRLRGSFVPTPLILTGSLAETRRNWIGNDIELPSGEATVTAYNSIERFRFPKSSFPIQEFVDAVSGCPLNAVHNLCQRIPLLVPLLERRKEHVDVIRHHHECVKFDGPTVLEETVIIN